MNNGNSWQKNGVESIIPLWFSYRSMPHRIHRVSYITWHLPANWRIRSILRRRVSSPDSRRHLDGKWRWDAGVRSLTTPPSECANGTFLWADDVSLSKVAAMMRTKKAFQKFPFAFLSGCCPLTRWWKLPLLMNYSRCGVVSWVHVANKLISVASGSFFYSNEPFMLSICPDSWRGSSAMSVDVEYIMKCFTGAFKNCLSLSPPYSLSRIE